MFSKQNHEFLENIFLCIFVTGREKSLFIHLAEVEWSEVSKYKSNIWIYRHIFTHLCFSFIHHVQSVHLGKYLDLFRRKNCLFLRSQGKNIVVVSELVSPWLFPAI